MLEDLGVPTPIWTMPVEIRGAIPFDQDGNPRFVDDPCAADTGLGYPAFPALAIWLPALLNK